MIRVGLSVMFGLIVAMYVLAACSQSEDGISEEVQGETAELGPARGEGIAWSPCGNGLECGFVDVPADYRDPDAGDIKIAVNMRRAASVEERIGYLLVNPGGPGESGLEFVQSSIEWPDDVFSDEVVSRFDIIGFDPRGVGESEPSFACGDPGEWLSLVNSIEGEVDTPEETAAGEAAANLCIETMGKVGGLLHSEYVARDMDEIRKALGVAQISYLGFSYGSTLGVWYVTLFPDSVRAMVVDGADNPVDRASTQQDRVDEGLEEYGPFETMLNQALAACDDPECPIYNGGDPTGYYERAVEKIHLVNSAAGEVPWAGFLGIITPLYDQEAWPLLWDALYELNEYEDPEILLSFVQVQLGDDLTATSFTAHVNCLDDMVLKPQLDRPTRLEDKELLNDAIEENYPLVGATAPWGAEICPFYDQFAPDPLERPLDGGGVPILVIGNHSDPATPFGESEELATEVLSDGRLVETYHPRHTVYPGNRCVNGHVHRALFEQVYPGERVLCEREE